MILGAYQCSAAAEAADKQFSTTFQASTILQLSDETYVYTTLE